MAKTENEIERIDIRNKNLMIKLGIHYPDYEEPNFSKTLKERKLLNKLKRGSSDIGRMYGIPKETPFPLYDKLVICLKKNNNFPKTTYSYKAWQYQISNIIRSFKNKKGNSVVDHYIWNGKNYSPTELPVNPYKCLKSYR